MSAMSISRQNSIINQNHAAFAVGVTAATVAIGSICIAATTTAGTVAIVALSILSVVALATTYASITAWSRSDSTSMYFKNLKKDLPLVFVGVATFISQIFVSAFFGRVAENAADKLFNRR